jgi:hypothetical protein
MRKVEEEVAWFDKYFFKTTKPENEAVKEGSPLFAKFKAKAVGATNGIYGTSYTAKGPSPVLIPEVVKRDSLEIGRFEVTTDQVTAFSIANSQAAKKNSKYAMAAAASNQGIKFTRDKCVARIRRELREMAQRINRSILAAAV